uniref:Homeobox domain-containing protein n=1 Tax=Kalanchoe fedtschenkoi TaxID=63787 RepID=A0A7N0V274_KALFE
MVSQNTPSSSGILHHFIASDPNPSQTQLNQRLDAYISAMRCNDAFPQPPPAGLPSIQSLGERMSRSIDLVRPPTMAEDSEISHTRHLVDLLGTNTPETGHPAQRLSLSLGSQMLLSQSQYRQRSYNHDLVSPHYSISSEEGREGGYSPGAAGQASDHFAYSPSSLVNTVRGSKYLKAVQSLLQEVVNTSDYEAGWDDYGKKLSVRGRRAARLSSELSTEMCSNGFLSDEKQELHLKFAKLVSLLEEVESRYERYCHQMQEVVSSFELIAGAGSARCYTGLALQAMSKHFFSLSDAILSQIHLTKKKMYQDSPRLSSGASQLTLFDQEGKHNRLTLQQIGLLHGQRQAWRPIRGLPETSVVILRAWLFEHFLHPYPTESEKLILSSQTGLSKNQVSNWFINARVRLWKPMIEEMYKEEFADSDSDPLGTSGGGGTLHFEE